MGINKDEIQNEVRDCEKMIEHIKRELKKSDVSTVKFRKKGKYAAIYEVSGSKKTKDFKEKYISIYSDRARECARIKYYTDLLPVLTAEAEALKHTLENYNPEEKYSIIGKYPGRISEMITPLPVTLADKGREWSRAQYERNPVPVDEPIITILKNHVRSKAEASMADWMFYNGIPYRYEAAYRMNGRTYYPDFTILSPYTGEKFYIEYFGLMDNPEYAKKTLQKIMDYSSTPDGHRFIYVFEGMGHRFSPEKWKRQIWNKINCNRTEVNVPVEPWNQNCYYQNNIVGEYWC